MKQDELTRFLLVLPVLAAMLAIRLLLRLFLNGSKFLAKAFVDWANCGVTALLWHDRKVQALCNWIDGKTTL